MNGVFVNKTDEEIINMARNNDDVAMEYIIKKYSYIVKKETRAMYIIGADSEDLSQEGMIGLFKAIRDFDPLKEVEFSGFARLCVRRQIYNAINSSTRKKHGPLNSYISFYSKIENDDSEVELLDILETSEANPEQMILERERVTNINNGINKRLSTLEKKVLKYYLQGLSYTDIGMKLNRETKSIDNAIQRIRSKLNREK